MEAVDPRTMHVLIRDKNAPKWQDDTWRVAKARRDGKRVVITYTDGKEFPYGEDRVRIYDQVERRRVDGLDEIRVCGQRWNNVEIVWTLRRREDPREPRYTLTYRKSDGTLGTWRYGSGEVRVTYASAQDRQRAATLDYVREEVRAHALRAGARRQTSGRSVRWAGNGSVAPSAILANVWENLAAIPRGSALEAFLEGTSSAKTGASDDLIMPFPSNIDQRNAIRAALTHQISIIDGPPGTGKTQTILNLIATLIAQGKTVGVVAGANSAVDNVVDKLTEEGYGFLVANLGNAERVKEFRQREGLLEKRREEWARKAGRGSPESGPMRVDAADLRAQEERLVGLWEDARDVPAIRASLTRTLRERRLFEEKARDSRRPLADISHLPVVRRSSETIADLLALARCAPRPGRGPRGLVERVRRYFAYGSLRGLDLGDADVQSAIQAAFYAACERELTQRIEAAEARAARHGLVEESAAYRQRSREALDSALLERFSRARPGRLDPLKRLDAQTPILLNAYPIVASTCFSIRFNLAEDVLLDWIIIDESSQVVLPQGLAALSKARNAVIVGDAKQLGPILAGWEESDRRPPQERFDVRTLSLLDSVKKMPEDAQVPSTLLKEHYRCHPSIIEFCNRMYYGGQLIPMRRPAVDAPHPLAIVYAAPGNHARRTKGGSRFSQREIDIIAELEEMDLIRRGVAQQDKDEVGDFVLGIVTPFRGQASNLNQRLAAQQSEGNQARWLAETAHKFQGRGAGTVILSTVLNADDPSAARGFFDAEPMTNVIVSRAKDRLIVVTANGGVRHSRNITALLDYIRMEDPRSVIESDIVSIFDVLYSSYSASLEKYARVKWADAKRSPAENVADLCLRELLAEPAYQRLGYAKEVYLRDSLPHVHRLNEAQRAFVYTDSALDFGVYSRVTGRLLLAVEVDGWAFHGDSDKQRKRDSLKDSIMAAYGVPVLRLPTNGSGEERLIREALDQLA